MLKNWRKDTVEEKENKAKANNLDKLQTMFGNRAAANRTAFMKDVTNAKFTTSERLSETRYGKAIQKDCVTFCRTYRNSMHIAECVGLPRIPSVFVAAFLTTCYMIYIFESLLAPTLAHRR